MIETKESTHKPGDSPRVNANVYNARAEWMEQNALCARAGMEMTNKGEPRIRYSMEALAEAHDLVARGLRVLANTFTEHADALDEMWERP